MGVKAKPYHLAYVVEDIKEDESFWTCIGASFPHKDRKGLNIMLRALPVDGRIVLRKYNERPPEKDAAGVSKKTSPSKEAAVAKT